MTQRINARLDAEVGRKLAYLCERTGHSTTDIIKASISAYYDQVRGQCSPAGLLGGFIGCAEGDPDLSVRYREELTRSLTRKGQRRGHR
jgi:hypothetical protein